MNATFTIKSLISTVTISRYFFLLILVLMHNPWLTERLMNIASHEFLIPGRAFLLSVHFYNEIHLQFPNPTLKSISIQEMYWYIDHIIQEPRAKSCSKSD